MSRKGEFMDAEGLDMLSLKMIKGNYTSLNDLHSIVFQNQLQRHFLVRMTLSTKGLK